MISLFPGSLFTRILNSPVEILSSKKMCLFSSSWPTCCYFSFPISYFVCGVQYFLCAVFVSAALTAYFLHKIQLEASDKSNANRNATNLDTTHWRFWHLAYPRDPRETTLKYLFCCWSGAKTAWQQDLRDQKRNFGPILQNRTVTSIVKDFIIIQFMTECKRFTLH